ncbi:FYVE zinc finger domain-containing protein, partial [Lacticaseibacillus paracasei]
MSLPWQYDDLVTNCYQCTIVFIPILQNKHHCRLCGNIFCQNCSSKRCLIPPTRIVLVP